MMSEYGDLLCATPYHARNIARVIRDGAGMQESMRVAFFDPDKPQGLVPCCLSDFISIFEAEMLRFDPVI